MKRAVLFQLPDGTDCPATIRAEHGAGTGYWCADLTVTTPDGSKLQVREAYRDEQPRPGAWREAPPAAPQAPQARGSRQRRA